MNRRPKKYPPGPRTSAAGDKRLMTKLAERGVRGPRARGAQSQGSSSSISGSVRKGGSGEESSLSSQNSWTLEDNKDHFWFLGWGVT